MESLNYSDIKNKILTEGINFVAFVMTPWHLVGAKAAMQFLHDRNIEIKPLIILLPHVETGFMDIIDEEVILHKLDQSSDVHINYLHFISFLIGCFKKQNNKESSCIYFSNPWWGYFKNIYRLLPSNKKDFKIIIFEEGLASYRYGNYNIRAKFGKIPFMSFLQNYIDLKLSARYQKEGRLIYLTPFLSEKDRIIGINDLAVHYYKRVLNISSKLDPNKAILIMQGSNEAYTVLFREVVKMLSSLGIYIYIKPHPRIPVKREDFALGDNRFEIITDKSPVEKIYEKIGAKYVVGFDSTAIITLRVFCNTTSISLSKLLPVEVYNTQRTKFEDNPYEWFINSFEKVLVIPQRIEEIKDIIQNDRC